MLLIISLADNFSWNIPGYVPQNRAAAENIALRLAKKAGKLGIEVQFRELDVSIPEDKRTDTYTLCSRAGNRSGSVTFSADQVEILMWGIEMGRRPEPIKVFSSPGRAVHPNSNLPLEPLPIVKLRCVDCEGTRRIGVGGGYFCPFCEGTGVVDSTPYTWQHEIDERGIKAEVVGA